MNIVGWSILVAGWLLVLATLTLLPPGAARNAFIVAACGVEGLGFTMVARAHARSKADRG